MIGSQDRRETALRLLSSLAQAHGASGFEHAVRRIFRNELTGDVRTDKTGSAILEKTGSSATPRIMLAGHMDEVGFMVQAITRAGLIKFVPLGSWWSHTLLAQRMRILTASGNEILGVIGAKPPHFLTEGEREKLVKVDDMFVDVGATSAEEVRDRFGIRVGDTMVPDSAFTPMHNPDYLLCKAFDDRAGMAVTIHAMLLLRELSHPNTVCGVGTVQEEVGTRGAYTAVHSVKPDVAVVIEGTPADDFPAVPEDERQAVLGKGVQIRLMDPSAVMHAGLVRHVREVAEERKIAHQVAVRKSGGTDARAIQLHASGVPTVVLGVPARYIHTHNSIIHIGDYLSALELVLALVQSLDAATVDRLCAFEA